MNKGGQDNNPENLNKALNAIDLAVKSHVPPNMLADVLIKVGWPPDLINKAIDIYLKNNGQVVLKTDFKTWLKKYQKLAIPAVILVIVLSTIQAGVALLKPWPIKIIADSAFNTIPAPWPLTEYTGKPELIAFMALFSVIVFLLGAVIAWYSDHLLLRAGFLLNRRIKSDSLRHILHLPLYHQERLAKGDYVYRQNVVTNSLSDLVLGTTAGIISSIIMIISVLIIMLHFSPKLTLISVVLMPFLYLTMKIIGPHLGFYSQKLAEVNSDTASAINESVDNAETVQSLTLEDRQLKKVDEYWWEGYHLSHKNMMWGNLLENSNMLLVTLATASVMYFGGIAAMSGSMTFGQLFIFMIYMGYLLGPIETLVEKITSRYQKVIDVGRVYEVLSDHEGVEDLRKNNPIPGGIRGFIDFQNVQYSYNDQVVLQDLNLHIEEGEKVAIIGPSGAGKSTILKLVPLFIEPQAGKISIGGFDTQSFSLQDLRKKIAWVSQAPQLFTGSVVDNIYDGDIYRPVSADEIKDAIEVSNALEFLIKMPLGVNSPVGENGSFLSGGQKQRVAIARSLIKNAPILCLDEPTASLDAKSENYIRDALPEIIANRTVLMVTHRKSLLALMDTIYVLEDGVLRNVNELGGLDAYLQTLEGINNQIIEKEIKDEQAYILPNAVDDHIGMEAVVQPEIMKPTEPATTGETQISHENDKPEKDKEEKDDEVVINLH